MVFEVEYLCNRWVKKNGVNANLIWYDWSNFDTPIDFAFRPRFKGKGLNQKWKNENV